MWISALPVTLKVLNLRLFREELARRRFFREARSAASVRHPNVASVYHLGSRGHEIFYAMEFVEGETLENLIKRSGRLEVKLALEIATQVAAGLAAVHKQNLVHRDIKPSNIMVSLEEGGAVTAKIIDLGLAKAINEPDSQTAISILGLCWYTRVSPAPSNSREWRRHPLGPVLAGRDALGDADRPDAISRLTR